MKPNSIMNLVVIRTNQINKVLSFYQTLGLVFQEEQHGKGPVHYACEHEQIVFEIYPGKEAITPDWKKAGAVMLGFKVNGLNEIVKKLKDNGIEIITNPVETDRGLRASMSDPDGRRIELIE